MAEHPAADAVARLEDRHAERAHRVVRVEQISGCRKPGETGTDDANIDIAIFHSPPPG
jgi:hypothetical protein